MNNEIIYETPKWAIRLLIFVIMIMVLGFTSLGVTYEKWAPNSPMWFKYFFYGVVFIALVGVYRLASWKRWVYFKGDTFGMSFPCPKLKKCQSEYLFIPWDDIKNITMKKFRSSESGITNGVSIDIRISLDNRNQYFPALLLKEHSEWTNIGFTDVFLKKKEAISQLNKLRSKSV